MLFTCFFFQKKKKTYTFAFCFLFPRLNHHLYNRIIFRDHPDGTKRKFFRDVFSLSLMLRNYLMYPNDFSTQGPYIIVTVRKLSIRPWVGVVDVFWVEKRKKEFLLFIFFYTRRRRHFVDNIIHKCQGQRYKTIVSRRGTHSSLKMTSRESLFSSFSTELLPSYVTQNEPRDDGRECVKLLLNDVAK